MAAIAEVKIGGAERSKKREKRRRSGAETDGRGERASDSDKVKDRFAARLSFLDGER